jgi:hypothetical protein
MHYAHVNCKEKTMNRYLLEEFHSNPALLRRRLTTEAHRQRALAVADAIGSLFGAVGRVYGYLKARLTARPGGWIERLG